MNQRFLYAPISAFQLYFDEITPRLQVQNRQRCLSTHRVGEIQQPLAQGIEKRDGNRGSATPRCEENIAGGVWKNAQGFLGRNLGNGIYEFVVLGKS